MTVAVFIDGAEGTTGLEIRERLAGRGDIALRTLDEHHRKDVTARRAALNDADIVILCLPDQASRDAVALIDNARTRVIDASSAHRVAPDWTYGFAELAPDQADRIANSARVTNPGCYPTGFLALVAPLVRQGLIPTSYALGVHATSGYSGGGKAMIAEFESGGAPAFRAYATGLAHKHVPEMQRYARLDHPPLFTPAVAAAYRGMIVEVPLPLFTLPDRPTLADLRATLADAYANDPIVQIGSPDGQIALAENAGTDRMTLRVCGNDAAGQALLVATLDNLGKGAAGAAVQNLNLMAGVDPTTGLVL